ncbi:MAG: T9SS type A sorting domain-containing protein [Bacteroidetes bacterium]|nr:T9SS type A sorting domain-containing protein [Bacteroidota bacterium]
MDFQQTPDLGYIILCSTSSASEPTVIKTNNLGTPEWVKIYNTSMGRFYGTHVEIGNDRNYILAGLVSPPIAGLEIGLLKIDSLGNTLWGTSYGSPSNNVANSVQQVQDSTFIISSNLQGLGSDGSYFMKTEHDGFSTCNYTPLILSDSVITMAVDSYVVWMTPGYVEWFPTPATQSIQVLENILCINTGIKQTENAAPDFEIYPNPFSSEFSVRFANNDGIKRNLRILNVLGQELYQSSTTESSILISSVNWAQGMYQCIISEENSTVRSKMIVLSCQNCD